MDSTTDDSVPAETHGSDQPTASSPANGAPASKSAKQFKGRIAKSRRYKRNLIEQWRRNIDQRRGKMYDEDSDNDRIAVTFDWSATKAKQAGLFSQVPQIRLKPTTEAYRKGVPVFSRKVNDVMGRAGVGIAMDECLPDCINAAGFGLVKFTYETRTEDRDMPVASIKPTAPPAGPPGAPPPEGAAPGAPPSEAGAPPASGAPSPKVEKVPYTTAKRFICERMSPSDGLWDLSSAGSNFNRAPWVGHTGRMRWSQGKVLFNLLDSDKEDVCGSGTKSHYDSLTNTEDTEHLSSDTEVLVYDEIYYWRYLFHDDERSFEAIQRMVFVHGLTRNDGCAVDEPWKGQKRVNADGQDDPEGEIILGSCLPPVQFLTLTYLTDEAIPPSDTAMGRPQVEEMMASRTDLMLNRRYSRPMRWFNNNLVAPEMVTALMRGTWQGLIPINGNGDRAIGEVARAAYPREDFESDRIFKTELGETWNIGGAQGVGGGANTQIRTAAEANNAQSNMQTRVSYERARTVQFFCNIAQVAAGLVALFGDWTEEEKQALDGLDLRKLPSYYTYTVRADASVMLTADDRYKRLESFWNMTAKSGMVDELPILAEMAGLLDIDESVVKKPEPKGVEPANVSLRIDAESLKDPIVVGMLLESGQMPKPETLEAAKKLIMASMVVPPPAAPGMPPGEVPLMPGTTPGQPPPPPNGMLGNGATPPDPVRPDLNMADRVEKRIENGR